MGLPTSKIKALIWIDDLVKYHLTFFICLFSFALFFFFSKAQNNPQQSSLVAPTTLQTTTIASPTDNTGGFSLQKEVFYSAKDSINYDVKKKILYLYQDVHLKYEDIELVSGYFKVFQKSNTLFARGVSDSLQAYNQKPIFEENNTAPILCDSLYYNLKTKKGKIFNTFQNFQESYFSGGQSKKISEKEIAIKDVVYTTCSKPDPHYGVFIKEGIVDEKRIITRWAFLMIENLVTPIGVPIGFFPKQNRKTSGITLPSFGEDDIKGFFLSDLGVYLSFNDYWSIQSQISIGTKSGFSVNNALNYRLRYRFNGNVNVNITQTPQINTTRNDYRINWAHRVDPKANPNFKFSINFNYQTASFAQNSFQNSANTHLQRATNTIGSSINMSRKWNGKIPITFSGNLNHTQNLSEDNKSITLSAVPNLTFNISRFNPFEKTKSKFLKAIFKNSSYGFNARINNRLPTLQLERTVIERSNQRSIDPITGQLIPAETREVIKSDFNFDNIKQQLLTNIDLNVPNILNGNYKIFKYFNFSFGIPYDIDFQLQSFEKSLNAGQVLVEKRFSVVSRQSYSTQIGLNTNIYGTKYFNNKFLKAIRHTLRPSISFSYRPNPDLGSHIATYIDSNGEEQKYNRFTGNDLFSASSDALSLGFSLNQSLELKVLSKKAKSGVSKPYLLIDNFNTSFGYNFRNLQHPFSDINFNGKFNIFATKKYYINASGRLRTYIYENGIRTQKPFWQEKRLPELENIRLSLNGFKGISIKNLFSKLKKKGGEDTNLESNLDVNPSQYFKENNEGEPIDNPEEAKKKHSRFYKDVEFEPFSIPWDIKLNLSLSVLFARTGNNPLRRTSLNSAINSSFNFSLSENWKISGTASYNLITRENPSLNFSVSRDLHCWTIQVTVSPLGVRKGFYFILQPKSNLVKNFLKKEVRQDSRLSF